MVKQTRRRTVWATAALLMGLGGAWAARKAAAAPPQVPVDFDGDRVSDFAVVRNTGGGPTGTITWFMLRSDELGMARPLFRSVTRTGTQVRLVFTTQAGTNYALQYMTSLTQTTWTTVGSVLGTGQTMTNFVTTPTNQVLNYRLRPT